MSVLVPIERGWRQRASAGAAQQARDVLPPIVAFFGLVAVWEVTVRALNLKQFILPSPVAIATAWSANLPVLDGRSADEILGYDEHGLPR